MRITIEHEGYRMVVEPPVEKVDIRALVQERRLEIEADLDEVPRWEVTDGDQVE
jgi:hypothetical protein